MEILRGKRLLLCVGGGIAAYKTCEVIRQLTAAGAEVQVAMTRGASAFITPLTLQTLSGKPVATDLLSASEDASIGHIRLASNADAVLVAPATANLIARMAAGMADDIVTATVLATAAPVTVAPAMNTTMLEHPAVRANISTLESYGYRIVEPDHGELACGVEGRGRLPDAGDLISELTAALSPQDLAGWQILISAGPTREPIDPVRHLSNRSSGKMGYAVAAAARRRGATVTLVSGPTALAPPRDCEVVHIDTAVEMAEAMRSRVASADAVVMVAAVADYRPARPLATKLKKGDARMNLDLEQTEDILAGLAADRGRRVMVGFAAETDDVVENARRKLAAKGLDLIVANDVGAKGSGFDVDTNAALFIEDDGSCHASGLVSKDSLADMLLDRVVRLRQRGQRAAS